MMILYQLMCAYPLPVVVFFFFRCAEEIATINKQFPAEPFKFLEPRFVFIALTDVSVSNLVIYEISISCIGCKFSKNIDHIKGSCDHIKGGTWHRNKYFR